MGQIRGLAFGLLKLNREEFFTMRVGEFYEAIDAYNKQVEADRRHIGELVRGAALRLFNIQVAKESRISDPVKFWKMPWDEQAEDKELQRLKNMSQEERDAAAKVALERLGLQ